MFVAPVWIFPLFNTFTPLPEGIAMTLTLALTFTPLPEGIALTLTL